MTSRNDAEEQPCCSPLEDQRPSIADNQSPSHVDKNLTLRKRNISEVVSFRAIFVTMFASFLHCFHKSDN